MLPRGLWHSHGRRSSAMRLWRLRDSTRHSRLRDSNSNNWRGHSAQTSQSTTTTTKKTWRPSCSIVRGGGTRLWRDPLSDASQSQHSARHSQHGVRHARPVGAEEPHRRRSRSRTHARGPPTRSCRPVALRPFPRCDMLLGGQVHPALLGAVGMRSCWTVDAPPCLHSLPSLCRRRRTVGVCKLRVAHARSVHVPMLYRSTEPRRWPVRAAMRGVQTPRLNQALALCIICKC